MAETAAIFEMDSERDRKTCIALDQKVDGANRALAQWLMDHPRYQSRIVAEWLGCAYSRINALRRWAQAGFVHAPFGKENKPDNRERGRAQAPLKTNNNSDEMPTEAEVEQEHQETILDQACRFLELMTDATRQKLFAHIRRKYSEA